MTDKTIHQIAPNLLVPSPYNRRIIHDNDPTIASLGSSIQALGQLEPVLARRIAGGLYEIIAGHRRHRACAVKVLPTVDCVLHEVDDATAKAMTLVENLQREGQHFLDEALSVGDLLEAGLDAAEVAAKVGHDARWVHGRASLRHLSPAWAEAIRTKPDLAWVGIAHAELIARLPLDSQAALLAEIDGWEMDAKELAQHIERSYTRVLSTAPWALDDLALYPTAKACTDCPKRASCQTALWPETIGNDRCLDATCWTEKHRRWVIGEAKRIAAKSPAGVVAIVAPRGGMELGDLPAGLVKVESEYHLTHAKKGTPGAIQAFDVRTGKTTWATPSATYCPPATAKALGGSKPAKATPEKSATESKGPTPADRRLAKRLSWRLEHLAEAALNALEIPPPANLLQIYAHLALENGHLRRSEAWNRIDAMTPEIALGLIMSDLIERLHTLAENPVFATQLDLIDTAAIERLEGLLQLHPAEQATKALAEFPEPRTKAANLTTEG